METVCDEMVVDVLVVDSDEVARDAWGTILREPTFTVRAVQNADQALEEMRARPCQATVLDLNIGVAQALDVLAKLRREWPSSPVVMSSGEGAGDVLVQAVRCGACGFVTKPILSADSAMLVVRNAAAQARVSHEVRLAREDAHAVASNGTGPLAELPRLVGEMAAVADVGYTNLKSRVLTEFDRAYLTTLLARTDGNISRAARLAELDRSNFRRLMKRTRAR